MNEGRRVLFEEIDWRDVLPLHDRFREILCQFVFVRKGSGSDVHVNHGHGVNTFLREN
jgi:hypothetical protein